MSAAAISSAFVAVFAYRKTLKDELAKKKDMDAVSGQLVKYQDNNDARILDIEKNKASFDYVNQQDRALRHSIDVIEQRTNTDIRELRSMVTDIHTLLIGKK
jgi:hypothetical protein